MEAVQGATDQSLGQPDATPEIDPLATTPTDPAAAPGGGF